MALLSLRLVKLVLFTAASLCGAVTAVELSWTQGSFSGDCPLYGVAILNGSSLALSCPSARSVCHFVAGTSGLQAFCCLLVCVYCYYTQSFRWCSLGLTLSLAIFSFLILVSACILRFGTISFCNSIISLKLTTSCSEAQKISWTLSGTTVKFYSNLHNAEISSWVNLVLCCVVLMFQVMECSSEHEYQALESSLTEEYLTRSGSDSLTEEYLTRSGSDSLTEEYLWWSFLEE